MLVGVVWQCRKTKLLDLRACPLRANALIAARQFGLRAWNMNRWRSCRRCYRCWVKNSNPNRFMGACVDITVPRNTSLLRLKLDKFFEDQTSGLEIRDEAKVLSHNNRVDFETAIISRRNLNWPWRGNLESQFNWKSNLMPKCWDKNHAEKINNVVPRTMFEFARIAQDESLKCVARILAAVL